MIRDIIIDAITVIICGVVVYYGSIIAWGIMG